MGEHGRKPMMKAPSTMAKYLIAVLLLIGIVPACFSDNDPEPTPVAEASIPGMAVIAPTASPPEIVEATPTIATWVAGLVTAETDLPTPSSIFFLQGPDVWILNPDFSAEQVTHGSRVSHVATASLETRAAAVYLTSVGGRAAEEIRIIDQEGNESEPVFGPEITEAPAANARIRDLVWSPDGSTIAVVREDGSIWLAGEDRVATQLSEDEDGVVIERVAWAPGGSAIATLVRKNDESKMIRLIPLDAGAPLEPGAGTSIADMTWLPGNPMIVYTEDNTAGWNPAAGSIFTILPDGTDRSLLVSAGEFGPVIAISHLTPSPDGSLLAFTVSTPNDEGEFQFEALYTLDVSTRVLREFPVTPWQGVSELWWFSGGLAWRATEVDSDMAYDGVEPFLIEIGEIETGETRLIHTGE